MEEEDKRTFSAILVEGVVGVDDVDSVEVRRP